MDWPHAPIHRLDAPGAYFITAGTFLKQHFFNTRQRLDSLQALLFGLAESYKFLLQAWAIFSNHYHFIVTAERERSSLAIMIRELHSRSAREVNRVDGVAGRRVWFQFWDKHLTFRRQITAGALRRGLKTA